MKLPLSNLITTRPAAAVFCTIIVLLSGTAKAATPISTCTTISVAGNYIVTAPISCGTDAILIRVSHVTLSLNGFNVTGNPSAIHAVSVSNVVILGPGSATNSGSSGILFEGVQDSQVIGVNANHNPIGIYLIADGAGTIPANNTLAANKANQNTTGIQADVSQSNKFLGNECSNQGTGLFIASGQGDLIQGNKCDSNTTGIEFIGTSETVVANEADANINVGIFVLNAGGNHLRNNEATSNGVDLLDGNPCMTNNWSLDAFFTSNSSCIH